MKNVLLLRTSSMGDLIHTWPALTELAQHQPDTRITWLAEEAFVDIPGLHPQVQATLPIAWRRWRKHLLARDTWQQMATLKQALQGTRWDLVLDAQGLLKSALPGWLANGPLAGYDAASIREPQAARFYDKHYTVSRQLSAIERNRRLFAAAFGYEVSRRAGVRHPCRCPPGLAAGRPLRRAAARHQPRQQAVAGTALAGAGRRAGRARPVRGTAVGQCGGTSARAQRLAAAMPGAVVAPRVPLREAAALLGHATAVVGVDTGLTHLANALDVPLVAIYTDTDPALTGVVETARAANIGRAGEIPAVDAVLSLLARVRGAA